MIAFPSIEQFKHLIKEVTSDSRYSGRDEHGNSIWNNDPLPILDFIATCKAHGTNASIFYKKKSETVRFQSRTRQLTLSHDNLGFCAYGLKYEKEFLNLCKSIIGDNDTVTIFGEWAGPGIQSGVAVSNIPNRIFMPFSILFTKDDNRFWVDTLDLTKYIPDTLQFLGVYNSIEFGVWYFTIDFNNPEFTQNKLIELTEAIEHECPIGKYFGVSGIGEGIVISHNLGYKIYRCKVKGEKHSNTKVKKLAPIDEEEYKNVQSFVQNYVTESRLEQGIFVMKNEMELEIDIKNLGTFIKWVVGDVIKEEQQSIVQNDLDVKKIAKEIGNVARKWFMQKYC
jgi:CxxC motif-containing protein